MRRVINKTQTMTRRGLVKHIAERLAPLYGGREASSIASVAAEYLCGFSRREMIADPEREVWLPENFEDVVSQLENFRPVQYVVGRTEFCGREFCVGEGVLIPRPETEELVDWVVKTADGGPCRILDVGTGSGCIAVSLAARLSGSSVTALDISAQALDYARRNAELGGVSVDFVEGDILDERLDLGLFDIIVSNPPYVPASDAGLMCRNVLDYEPHNALFVPDDDWLLFYRAVSRFAGRSLRAGGRLFFEIYENAAHRTAAMLEENGFYDVEIRNDLNSKPRMIRCRK